ncbi:DNA replication factor C, large subunit [Trichodelitschia bisporula]|uniref:Replication factor C subunit 1 n=1 Tax=Trichodelitschia bisporula TaxID=703511 RepID=A0A6G1HW36_9PEZI|nr:DNA replication factor C, large subunit [Trichodelitschia bisporula]
MPDIRDFFGAKGGAPKPKAPAKKDEPKGRAARKSAIIDDSEEDDFEEVAPKKTTSKKPAKPASPKGKPTTSSDYFKDGGKPKRSEPVRANMSAKPALKENDAPVKKEAGARGKAAKTEDLPTHPKKVTSHKPTKREVDLEDLDNDDDVFKADFKGKRAGDDYEESTADEEDTPLAPRETRGKTKVGKKEVVHKLEEDNDDMDLDFEAPVIPAKKGTTSRKRKSEPVDSEAYEAPAKKSKATPAPAKKKAKKDDAPESSAMQAILDSIPTVRPPTPPPRDTKGKFDFAARKANQAVPAAAGSKEIPIGAPNCLAGLTFVFTGLLETLSRDDGQALVKRYGGKITGAPSRKTSYVVLGSDAGPKKLETIKQHGLKVINEDGLFALIRSLPATGGDGKAAALYEEQKQKEVAKIKALALEQEEEERKAAKAARDAAAAKAAAAAKSSAGGKSAATSQPAPAKAPIDPDNQLWTVRYAPSQLTQVCGNKGQVEKLQDWLRKFRKSEKSGFKLPGPNGAGVFRAVILSGPPGIGKTTAAHLVAKLEGYDVVENNASDTRSKKMVEEGLKGVLSTTSLAGYFAGDAEKVDMKKKRLVLIMDEVDGMSAGDRGGVGALAALCKKTHIPIILICNDRNLPKMKPFTGVAFDIPFRRPTVDQIRSRIMTIAFREKLNIPPAVINALIEGTHADIRQVVNMLSSIKLDEEAMSWEKGVDMSKAWEKSIVLKPWDITNKILGGGMFAETSRATLNDKIELYFNDHEFSPLMLQENYLGTNPVRSNAYHGREKNLKHLELVEQAAASISDGDLVDRMIHGTQQQWSLMPTHAVFSFVRPASFVAGSLAGNQTRFTSWLGNNSKQGKLSRFVKEIQGHMRLRSSADRHEIRQDYIPMLWTETVQKLSTEGKTAVPQVIDLLDSYYLSREDYEAIQELGVGRMSESRIKIDTQTKSTFTRTYNGMSHPLSYTKASSVFAPKSAAKDKPDLEEALEESDEGEVVEEAKDPADEEIDLSKDKLIKAPKKKAAPKAAAKKRARADDDDVESEDVKQKRGRPARGETAARGARGGKGKK